MIYLHLKLDMQKKTCAIKGFVNEDFNKDSTKLLLGRKYRQPRHWLWRLLFPKPKVQIKVTKLSLRPVLNYISDTKYQNPY